ncbi:MAG: YggS family pyridoxal phosphate-dependent enzyme [Acidimicrobiia bacterium]
MGRRVTGVATRLAEVRARVAAAERRAGRAAGSVTLVGASKTVSAARVAEALAAGLCDLGENRAQDLLAKAPELADLGPRWHFVGQLQRNKVKALAKWVSCWQSVDRAALVDTLARLVPGAAVLVEVNLGGEAAKGGCEPGATGELVDRARAAGLDVLGLMTVPPAGHDPRPYFARLREQASGLGLHALSMGMTDDFEAAIEEGATVVRVGRAIFGDRPGPETGAEHGVR